MGRLDVDLSLEKTVSGGVRLLFSDNITDYRRYLACLGSSITIFALGLPPFLQQTIKYPSRLVASSESTAQVVFATSYDGQSHLAIMLKRLLTSTAITDRRSQRITAGL